MGKRNSRYRIRSSRDRLEDARGWVHRSERGLPSRLPCSRSPLQWRARYIAERRWRHPHGTSDRRFSGIPDHARKAHGPAVNRPDPILFGGEDNVRIAPRFSESHTPHAGRGVFPSDLRKVGSGSFRLAHGVIRGAGTLSRSPQYRLGFAQQRQLWVHAAGQWRCRCKYLG